VVTPLPPDNSQPAIISATAKALPESIKRASGFQHALPLGRLSLCHGFIDRLLANTGRWSPDLRPRELNGAGLICQCA
jgi:hypothetical protein